MRVKVTFNNGTTMYGELVKDEYVTTLEPDAALAWVMNLEHTFVPFIQPNGRTVQLNKSNVAYIVRVEDEED